MESLMPVIIFILFVVLLGGYMLIFANPFSSTRKKGKDKPQSPDTPIKSSYLLTEHEKTMFQKLKQLPDCHIFVQVSLGAILWTKSWQTRNKFNKKIADFVVTDTNFKILAVIELDDKSHDNKIEADKVRDAMVREAGYKVLRYRTVPSREQLAKDILI